LYEKPNSIEELTEMREWMKWIPEKVEEQQVNTQTIEKVFFANV